MQRVYACRDCGRRPCRRGRHWGGPSSTRRMGDLRACAGRCHGCEEQLEPQRFRLLEVLTRRRVQVAAQGARPCA